MKPNNLTLLVVLPGTMISINAQEKKLEYNVKKKCFGVSVMWWDVLFDTIPKKKLSAGNKLLNFYYKK